MKSSTFKEARLAFSSAMGEAIVAWNQAETVLRNLLLLVCGRSDATYILTADLGSQGIIDGLLAISPTQSEDVELSIKAVCKYYERIRTYRNYYIHGIIGIGWDSSTHIGAGLITSSSSKGKLAFHKEFISLSEITQLSIWAKTLMDATGSIIDNAYPQPGSFADASLPTAQTLIPPDVLQKKSHFPLLDQKSSRTDV